MCTKIIGAGLDKGAVKPFLPLLWGSRVCVDKWLAKRPSRVRRRHATYPHAWCRDWSSPRAIQVSPSGQHGEQVACRSVVEPPLAFLEEQVEVGFRDAVIAAQMSLGLVPEILDAIDLVGALYKGVLVIDPLMVEFRNIKNIIGSITIGVDNAVWLDAIAHNADKRLRAGVGDHGRVDFAVTFEQAEHRHLACRTTAPFALSDTTEVALVDFDLTHCKRRLGSQFRGNKLSQLVVKQRRRVAVDADQLGRRACRNAHNEVRNQGHLNTCRQTASATCRKHMTDNAFLRYLGHPQIINCTATPGTAVQGIRHNNYADGECVPTKFQIFILSGPIIFG